MTRMQLVCSCLTLFLVACDPGYHLSGSVKALDGKPIAGAVARTVCPKPPKPSATADAAGKLDGRGIGLFSETCTIEVSAPGYRTQSFPVGPSCSKRSMGSCVEVEIDAVLTPASP